MIIGTRGSSLALAQANIVAGILEKRGVITSQQVIKTTGDSFTDRPLHELDGVGAFVRELDERIISGEIQIAVHSMKDLPTKRPEELSTSAVLMRDSPHDILITSDGSKLDDLPLGAIIGTTSMRRRAQVLRYRPDLNIQDLRGNIDTRLKKLKAGYYDAIMLAEAGLQRMKWDDIDFERLNPDDFCPSANQGTIAVVTLKGSEADTLVSMIDHAPSRIETEVERIITNEVEGGCVAPVGAFAKISGSGNEIFARAEVLSLDGSECIRVENEIPRDNYREHALELGRELVEKGAKELVSEAVCQLSSVRGQ